MALRRLAKYIWRQKAPLNEERVVSTTRVGIDAGWGLLDEVEERGKAEDASGGAKGGLVGGLSLDEVGDFGRRCIQSGRRAGECHENASGRAQIISAICGELGFECRMPNPRVFVPLWEPNPSLKH